MGVGGFGGVKRDNAEMEQKAEKGTEEKERERKRGSGS